MNIPAKLPEPIRASEAVAKKSQSKARWVRGKALECYYYEKLYHYSWVISFFHQAHGSRSYHGNLNCTSSTAQGWPGSAPAHIRHSVHPASSHSTQETQCCCWGATGHRYGYIHSVSVCQSQNHGLQKPVFTFIGLMLETAPEFDWKVNLNLSLFWVMKSFCCWKTSSFLPVCHLNKHTDNCWSITVFICTYFSGQYII